MNYRDVTHTDFQTKRNINPLMPEYIVRDENDKVKTIGEVEGSKPCALPPKRNHPDFQATSLKTKDIEGCRTNSSTYGNFHIVTRRGFLTTNVTKDIPGAQTNTVKKSPVTLRQTNPLVPDY